MSEFSKEHGVWFVSFLLVALLSYYLGYTRGQLTATIHELRARSERIWPGAEVRSDEGPAGAVAPKSK